MKPIYLLAASGLALGVAACGPKTPPVRTALECPASVNELTRTAISPDGKSCAYTTSRGANVTLQLVSVQGGVDATLAGIENTLLADRIAKPEDEKAEVEAKADGAAAKADDKMAKADEKAAKAGEKAAKEAEDDAEDASADIEITQSGKTIVREHGDGTTHVNLPGIHITANDKDDSANVQVGPINIDAGGDGAKVHLGPRDVRLRGEPMNLERRGMRASFFYKGDDLPDGYRFVGYEAGGPKAGPITVAIVKSKASDTSRMGSGVTRLVRMNGGV